MSPAKYINIMLHVAGVVLILSLFGLGSTSFAQKSELSVGKFIKCAQFQISGVVPDVLAAGSNRFFVGTLDGSIDAFDKYFSSSVWRIELGGEPASNLAVTEASVVTVSNTASGSGKTQAGSRLRSLSKETGVPNWTTTLPFADRYFLGSTATALVAISSDGSATGIELQTGRILWQTHSFGKITARPYFSPLAVVFGTSEKKVVAVEPGTGAILFNIATSFTPTAITGPAEENLVVGDNRGNTVLLNIPDGKEIWKFKSGAAVTFVSVEEDGLLITSLDNFAYLISMYNGDVIWKRRLPGRVVEGGLALNGVIVIVVYGENSAFLIDSKTGKILDQIPPADVNFVNQVPVRFGPSRFVLATQSAITLYGTDKCDTK